MKSKGRILLTLISTLLILALSVFAHARSNDRSAFERRNYPGGRDDNDLTIQPVRQQTRATVISESHDEPTTPSDELPNADQRQPSDQQEEQPEDTESPSE